MSLTPIPVAFPLSSKIMRTLIFGTLCLHCIAASTTSAQPSTYYDKQAQNRAYDNLHAATTRAFSVPSSSSSSSSSTYKSPASSSGSSSSSSSSSYSSNAGGTIAPARASNWAMTNHYDWQVRQGEKIAQAKAARHPYFSNKGAWLFCPASGTMIKVSSGELIRLKKDFCGPGIF